MRASTRREAGYWLISIFIVGVTEISSQTLTNCSLPPCNSRRHKETKELQFVLGTSRAEQTIIIDPSPPRKHKHSAVQEKKNKKNRREAASSRSSSQWCFRFVLFLQNRGLFIVERRRALYVDAAPFRFPSSPLRPVFNPGVVPVAGHGGVPPVGVFN